MARQTYGGMPVPLLGDKVKIKKTSMYYGDGQGVDHDGNRVVGMVIKEAEHDVYLNDLYKAIKSETLSRQDHYVPVMWPDGTRDGNKENVYRLTDIEIIETKKGPRKKLTLKK